MTMGDNEQTEQDERFTEFCNRLVAVDGDKLAALSNGYAVELPDFAARVIEAILKVEVALNGKMPSTFVVRRPGETRVDPDSVDDSFGAPHVTAARIVLAIANGQRGDVFMDGSFEQSRAVMSALVNMLRVGITRLSNPVEFVTELPEGP